MSPTRSTECHKKTVFRIFRRQMKEALVRMQTVINVYWEIHLVI